jgi:phage terminase small subunit
VNEKYLSFCEAILQGKTQREAYEHAGFASLSEESTDASASRLIRHPDVAAYLAKRRSELQADLGVSTHRVLSEYAKLAFSDIGAVLEWDENGVKLRPLRELEPAITATISEISERTSKQLRNDEISTTKSIKVKLHNKHQALKDLAEHLGIFKQSEGGDSSEIDAIAKALENVDD